MADVQAENYLATYGSVPVGKTASNVNGGRMRVLYDSYEANALPDGDDILIGKASEGVVVHDFAISADALGAGVTLQLFTRDADGNEVAVSNIVDASVQVRSGPQAASIDNVPSFIATDVDYILKNVGGIATGTIKVQVFYSIT